MEFETYYKQKVLGGDILRDFFSKLENSINATTKNRNIKYIQIKKRAYCLNKNI